MSLLDVWRRGSVRAIMLLSKRTISNTMGHVRGWAIWSLGLLINGLLFNAFALGNAARYSEAVLRDCMTLCFAMLCIMAPILAMSTFADEHRMGTWHILDQSPWGNGVLVLGKFLGVWGILLGWLALSVYMPALILLNGNVSLAHMFTGYVGLVLVSGTLSALGILTSTLTRAPWFAALLHYALLGLLLLTPLLAQIVSTRAQPLLSFASIYHTHFLPLASGQLPTQSIAYHVIIMLMALRLAKHRLDLERVRDR